MLSSSDSLPNFTRRPTFFWLMLVFASLGIAFSIIRIAREYAPVAATAPIPPDMDFTKTGLFDFHMGGYFSALAFRHKVNPYAPEVREHYPVQRPAPTYSPIVFVTHVPFTYLPVPLADVVYYVFNLSLLGVLAYWAWTMSYTRPNIAVWMGVLGLFAFSRAGHVTLFSGYFTLQLVIGTVLAIHYAKTQPWLAGAGMLLASGKPTYIIPLTILMLARKNFKAVVIGLAFSAVVAVAGIGWLASESSVSEIVDGIQRGEKLFHADANETPENTWTRLDLIGIVAKVTHWKPDNKIYLFAMLGLLIPPCLAIWRVTDREQNSGATGLTGMIALLAILVTIYHHSYDCLLVAIPWLGVTLFSKRVCPEITKWESRILSLLLAFPAINYASTYRVRELLKLENHSVTWDILTSLNGICLLAALVMLIVASLRTPRDTPGIA